jgi:hypothetical protein
VLTQQLQESITDDDDDDDDDDDYDHDNSILYFNYNNSIPYYLCADLTAPRRVKK